LIHFIFIFFTLAAQEILDDELWIGVLKKE